MAADLYDPMAPEPTEDRQCSDPGVHKEHVWWTPVDPVVRRCHGVKSILDRAQELILKADGDPFRLTEEERAELVGIVAQIVEILKPIMSTMIEAFSALWKQLVEWWQTLPPEARAALLIASGITHDPFEKEQTVGEVNAIIRERLKEGALIGPAKMLDAGSGIAIFPDGVVISGVGAFRTDVAPGLDGVPGLNDIDRQRIAQVQRGMRSPR